MTNSVLGASRLLYSNCFLALLLWMAPELANAQIYFCDDYVRVSYVPGEDPHDGDPVAFERECWLLPASTPRVSFLPREPAGTALRRTTASLLSSHMEEGERETCERTDRPVVIARGQKTLPEADFTSGEQSPFGLARVYDSGAFLGGSFGSKWHSNIDFGLIFEYGSTQCASSLSSATSCSTTPAGLTRIFARRPGGARIALTLQSGVWKTESGNYELSQQGSTWVLWRDQGEVETYNAGGQPIQTRDERNIGMNFSYGASGQLTQVSHTSGRSMTFVWNGPRIASVTGPNSKVYSYSYTPQGYLQTVTYPDGLPTKTYHYEVAGKPWLLTGFSAGGVRQTRYSYYADGRVQESRDEDSGHRSTFSYSQGVTNVTNALGQTTSYRINSQGLIDQVSRPASPTCAGGVTSTTYDASGRPTQDVDGAGNITEYAYTSEGRLQWKSVGSTATDTTGRNITWFVWNSAQTRVDSVIEYGAQANTANDINETAYSYYPDGDPRARLVQSVTKIDRSPTAAPSRITTYDYTFHSNGEVRELKVDGPLSNPTNLSLADITVYEFNAAGDLVKVTQPLGLVTTFSAFTGLGKPGVVTDPNGLITEFTYDSHGRVLTQRVKASTGDRVTSWTYDARGNVLTATDPSGRTISGTYNLAGELTQMIAPAAFPMGEEAKDIRNIAYNGLGRMLGSTTLQAYRQYVIVGWQGGEPIMDWVVTDTKFARRESTYDSGGFLASSLGTNGQNVRYSYNANGDLSTVTDSLNNVTSTTYDPQGRVKSVTAPNQGTAYFEYNPLGWLTKVTDRNGNITTYTYNGHGDVTRVTSPDSGITDYTYSLAGKVLTMTRADGTVTSYTRDALGRVIQESATWPAYNGIAGAQTHSLTYDSCTMGKGRLCGMVDSTGSTSYTYLSSGELASQTSTVAAVSFGLTFTYDAVGRLSTATYPNGVILRYSYSSDHRVSRIEAKIGTVWKDVINNAVYQPFGGPLVGYAHGNGLNRQIDYDLDGRIKKIYGAGSTHPQNLTYTYNANDLITGITNSKVPGASQSYGYNAMNALTSANASVTGQHTWQYDANGNRLSHVWGGGTDTYTKVPGTNRLASMGGPRSRSATYDPMGNLRNEGRGGVTVERRYNGFNRQVKLIRPSAQSFAQPNGATLNLPAGTWDYGYNALGQRASKTQVGGSTTRYLFSPGSLLLGETNAGSNTLDTIYVWLEGRPVGLIRFGAVFAIHSDHLGRPEIVTNPAKTVVWRANNLAFDRNVTTDILGGLSLGFPGQQYDVEAGTWYNVFRDYDAASGQYTSSDPIGLRGGVNPYIYVEGNPISNVDPLGLRPLNECEKVLLKPYIPQEDLDNAEIHDGVVPWYLAKDMAGITRGNDIYFRPGVYAEGTIAGIALLAHELVHVGQYRDGMTWYKYLWSTRDGYSEDSKYERPAYDLQEQVTIDFTAAGTDCTCGQGK